jgi:two-component system, sporulation sensor kinase E
MSIKMKFSFFFTIIVLSFFVVQHMISEYGMVRSIQEETKQLMQVLSQHLADDVVAYENRNEGDKAGKEGMTPNPEVMFDIARHMNPNLKELTIFDRKLGEVLYGSYTYPDAGGMATIQEVGSSHAFILRTLNVEGKSYYRSYFAPGADGRYVISLVHDWDKKSEQTALMRNSTLIYTGVSMLIMLILSYWLVGALIRPLKDILWKVNEVSSVRFQKPIQIKRKDEFGLLALKINAMSQNLSIYMNKLRRAFEENRRMKEQLESFINHTSDAIHLFDHEGKLIQVNRAFNLLFGYEEEEAIGLINPTLPDSHMDEQRRVMKQLQAGKVLQAFETMRVNKAGDLIPVSETISLIRDSEGTIRAFASISRDMRSRNKMEELLRRSEKLTTVGQLAAGVAHEIRNPLTTLRGFLQLQKETQRLSISHVHLMLSELDRINLIVGEFLILAKPQAVRFMVKDARAVLQDVIALMNSEALLHNIEFTVTVTEEECLISCEENQLKQVFINLLKNAIEAMPGGGFIHLHIASKREYIAITITDEGEGIPEEMISKIGDPFFTGKETGTGLGIMVSQRIISSHKGTLEIKSKVGVGTTVKVLLPALKEAEGKGILDI